MAALLLSLGSFASTLAGGLLALRLRSALPWILAFTAGVLLGVVAFDVLPEAFSLAQREGLDPTHTMVALVCGFLFFHAVEKFILIHHAHEDGYAAHRHPRVGMVSAVALASHSFMDGVGIGLGFQVSAAAGIAVAIAVIAHDFCDGLNTVSLMLLNRNTAARSRAMLLVDALAPVAGAASTLFFTLPAAALGPYLGFFAGFLLYIGAADILPEAHSSASPRAGVGLMGLTALGAALMYLVSKLAG